MPKHRFIGEFNLKQTQVSVTEKNLIHQIINVLRLQKEDEVFLVNEGKQEAIAKIKEIKPEKITFELQDVYKNKKEPSLNVTLYLAILKKDNFEISAQKATEVGIKKIVPVITKRTIKKNVNCNRINKITKEAAEQSGRAIIPNLTKINNFKEAIEKASQENDFNLFFDLKTDSFFDFKFNQKLSKNSKIGVFIGPEGGWSKEEKELAEENKFYLTNLGKLTLRAETSVIIAGYLAVNSIKFKI